MKMGELEPMAPIEHPRIHADGLYFGLDEDEYHGALALSASGVKEMRVSAADFWASCQALNPELSDPNEADKPHFIDGKAYHKRLLEGREAFYATYARGLDPADHPDALRTVEEICARLDELGVAYKRSTRKASLIEQLLEHDIDAPVWDAMLADHVEAHEGREMLPPKLVDRIELAAAMIERHPELGPAFQGGYPEVSCFWRDPFTRVPMKCRFDRLKVRAIVDYKTAANPYRRPLDRAVAFAIATNKLHIQAAMYLEGAAMARRLIREGKVHGAVDPAFLDAFVAEQERTFLFVFQFKGRANVARGYVMGSSLTLDLGRSEIESAKAAFRENWDLYGADLWVDRASIRMLDSTEFPQSIAD